MAKRKVNRLLGQSAGYMGLDNYTTTLMCVALPVGGITFLMTQNLVPAIIAATAVGMIFQLVTNGKPGVFYNSMFKRPHWVRAQRRYINTWSHEFRPEHKGISYNPKAFWICGISYMVITTITKVFVVPGLLLFAVPLVPWDRLGSR